MKNFSQHKPGAFINIEGGALVLGFRYAAPQQTLAAEPQGEKVDNQVFWGVASGGLSAFTRDLDKDLFKWNP